MPIKWTPENDQALLIKILETSQVQVDVKAISKNWPSDKYDAKGNPPTARAISERLVKIRQNSKNNGNGHFSVTSAQSKSGGARNPTATPRKLRIRKEEPQTPVKQELSLVQLAPVQHSPVQQSFASSQNTMQPPSFARTSSSPVSVDEAPTPGSAAGVKRNRDAVTVKGEDDHLYAGEVGSDILMTPSKKSRVDALNFDSTLYAAQLYPPELECEDAGGLF